jgi:hypothetical protein
MTPKSLINLPGTVIPGSYEAANPFQLTLPRKDKSPQSKGAFVFKRAIKLEKAVIHHEVTKDTKKFIVTSKHLFPKLVNHYLEFSGI